jgi:hypothetical protein
MEQIIAESRGLTRGQDWRGASLNGGGAFGALGLQPSGAGGGQGSRDRTDCFAQTTNYAGTLAIVY